MPTRRKADLPTKRCATCGREMVWRRKWAKDWDAVRHCSARCRRNRRDPLDRSVEEAIVALLERRRPDASVCPSEVAREIAPDDWRPLMPRVRAVAAKLGADGRVRATQGAEEVDALAARGPIRLRRGKAFGN